MLQHYGIQLRVMLILRALFMLMPNQPVFHGAEFYTHTPVIETNQRSDGSWDVVTKKGNIHAEHIVNAGGLWARELGRMSGIHLPVVSDGAPLFNYGRN